MVYWDTAYDCTDFSQDYTDVKSTKFAFNQCNHALISVIKNKTKTKMPNLSQNKLLSWSIYLFLTPLIIPLEKF